MHHDLNIAWTPATTADHVRDLLAFSSSLGYGVVALNQTISSPILPNVKNPMLLPTSECPVVVLRRATVLLADPSANFRLPALQPLYDIIAVRPTTAQAFQSACLSLPDIALISLDLTTHIPYHIRPRSAMAAVARGVRFEICYAQFCSGPAASDPRARANFITNALSLVRATGGRGIVISSGAAAAAGLRPPVDVANLAQMWGMGPEKALNAVNSVARAVVKNEGLKRTGFRGVVNVLQRANDEPDLTSSDGVGGGNETAEAKDGITSERKAEKNDGNEDNDVTDRKEVGKDLTEISRKKDKGKRKNTGRDVADVSRGFVAKRAKKSRLTTD